MGAKIIVTGAAGFIGRNLVAALNERGEVPVNPDRSTKVPGFFAAGDVTDVTEKQISVAVGDGALAALTAYKYLVENKLATKTGIDDEWL